MIELAEIEAARARIAGIAVRTPLIRLEADLEHGAEIHLKLETLQPIGSFKLRGAANAVRSAARTPARLLTASAGNMAQGVAYMARRLGIPCQTLVPEHAPRAKLRAIERLGGEIVPVDYERWWETIVTGHPPGHAGLFIHPVQDRHVIAGNGTIALEILEELPDVDSVVIPFGGGGLTVGVASALRRLRPQTRIFTAEPATGAALAAALRAGAPTTVDYQPSFVDGAGSRRVLDAMWDRLSALIDDAFAVPLADVAQTVRLLAERVHVIAEGAGALAVAAALAGRAGSGRVVCIVSGGNIDFSTLSQILAAPAALSAPAGAASPGGGR